MERERGGERGEGGRKEREGRRGKGGNGGWKGEKKGEKIKCTAKETELLGIHMYVYGRFERLMIWMDGWMDRQINR